MAYEAWQKGRESILSDWLYHTDSVNLQPKIAKTNREVANYLRENAPKGLDQNELKSEKPEDLSLCNQASSP